MNIHSIVFIANVESQRAGSFFHFFDKVLTTISTLTESPKEIQPVTVNALSVAKPNKSNFFINELLYLALLSL